MSTVSGAANPQEDEMAYQVHEKVLRMDGVEAVWNISSGAPCVLPSRIATFILANRFLGGETVKELAKDYGLATDQVEVAIRYELVMSQKRLPRKAQRAHRPPRTSA